MRVWSVLLFILLVCPKSVKGQGFSWESTYVWPRPDGRSTNNTFSSVAHLKDKILAFTATDSGWGVGPAYIHMSVFDTAGNHFAHHIIPTLYGGARVLPNSDTSVIAITFGRLDVTSPFSPGGVILSCITITGRVLWRNLYFEGKDYSYTYVNVFKLPDGTYRMWGNDYDSTGQGRYRYCKMYYMDFNELGIVSAPVYLTTPTYNEFPYIYAPAPPRGGAGAAGSSAMAGGHYILTQVFSSRQDQVADMVAFCYDSTGTLIRKDTIRKDRDIYEQITFMPDAIGGYMYVGGGVKPGTDTLWSYVDRSRNPDGRPLPQPFNWKGLQYFKRVVLSTLPTRTADGGVLQFTGQIYPDGSRYPDAESYLERINADSSIAWKLTVTPRNTNQRALFTVNDFVFDNEGGAFLAGEKCGFSRPSCRAWLARIRNTGQPYQPLPVLPAVAEHTGTLQLVPNPARGQVHLLTTGIIKQAWATGVLGQTTPLLLGPAGEADISHLNKGVYYITALSAKQERLSQRLLVW